MTSLSNLAERNGGQRASEVHKRILPCLDMPPIHLDIKQATN